MQQKFALGYHTIHIINEYTDFVLDMCSFLIHHHALSKYCVHTLVNCRDISPIKKRPPPEDPPRTLGIGLLKGPTGGVSLMSEVPL